MKVILLHLEKSPIKDDITQQMPSVKDIFISKMPTTEDRNKKRNDGNAI